MTNCKNIVLVFIAIFSILLFSNQVYSETDGKYKTLYLGWTNKIKIFTPSNWDLKNRVDYIFVNKNAPNSIEVTVAKGVLKYNSKLDKLKLINAHKTKMLGRLKVNTSQVSEGIDNIAGMEVPWVMIFTQGKTSAKFLYPTINNKMYVVGVGFTQTAPFNEAEKLIGKIVQGIKEENTIANKPTKKKPVAKSKPSPEESAVKKDTLIDNSYSAQVISQSPDQTKLEYGTVLYSGAINTYSKEGKKLYKEHSLLAAQTVAEIDSLTSIINETRKNNTRFYRNVSTQLISWKQLAKQYPSSKDFLNLEKLIFATSLEYQLKENYHWATIDPILEELKAINIKDSKPVSQSITKSLLYTKLLLAYTDLVKFYDSKNKVLLPYCAFNHAAEQNAGANIPANALYLIKPLHDKEMALIELTFANTQKYTDTLNAINTKSDELKDFYNKMDNYSLNSIRETIKELEEAAKGLRAQQDTLVAQTDSLATLESYIAYFKNLEKTLESKILAYQMKEAVLAYLKNEDKILTASIKLVPSQLTYGSWGISFQSIKDKAQSIANGALEVGKKAINTAKAATGAVIAGADYATGKVAQTYYDYQAKSELQANYPDEYEKFEAGYNKESENIYVTSIKDTFIDPFNASLKGDHEHGLGQAGVNKFKGSVKEFEGKVDQVTGSNFVSNVVLNVATVGGYGLAKDYMTLNDANASFSDKAWATVGTVLSFVPVANASKSLKQGGSTFVNNLSKNVKNSQQALSNTCSKVSQASTTLKNLTNKASTLFDNMFSSASKNISPDDLVSTYGKTVFQKNVAQQALKNAEQELLEKTVKHVVNVPTQTLIESGQSAMKTFFSEMAPGAIQTRMKDMAKQSLSEVIKNSNNFIGSSMSKSIGLKDIGNFFISSSIDTLFNSSMTSFGQALTAPGSTPEEPVVIASSNTENSPTEVKSNHQSWTKDSKNTLVKKNYNSSNQPNKKPVSKASTSTTYNNPQTRTNTSSRSSYTSPKSQPKTPTQTTGLFTAQMIKQAEMIATRDNTYVGSVLSKMTGIPVKQITQAYLNYNVSHKTVPVHVFFNQHFSGKTTNPKTATQTNTSNKGKKDYNIKIDMNKVMDESLNGKEKWDKKQSKSFDEALKNIDFGKVIKESVENSLKSQ